MSLRTMTAELSGTVSRAPWDLCQTFVQRAWKDVRLNGVWSFQFAEGNWRSPTAITTGTVTVTQGSASVVFDSTASTAITTVGATAIVQRQFRIGIGTIYNIIAYSLLAGIVTLTLDRVYQETTTAAATYSIFQCYYPAPVQDWREWVSIRDLVNSRGMNFTSPRDFVDDRDPQRVSFTSPPTLVLPYLVNPVTTSSYYGWMMFELYGQPTTEIVYQLYYRRYLTDLASLDSTLPAPLGEELIISKAKTYLYEWAEANKDLVPKSTSDFRFLIGTANAEYKNQLSDYRRADRPAMNSFFSGLRRVGARFALDGYYNTVSGYANPGAPW